jgi:nucleoside-diphosphate-sugar epimerase
MSENKRTVLVTGVTGYLATEIAHQLLEKGIYNVRGTVRSLDSEASKKLKALFPGLVLYEADLEKPGSFKHALEGCDVLIHAASPFPSKVDDPEKELINPAVNGTKNVLNSVSELPQITHVVATGSCAAVVDHFPTDDGSKVWSEEDWNTTSTLKDGPYRLSKVLAEKYIYEWAEKHPKVTVATILPSFIIGPPHTDRADATSIKFIKAILDGTYLKDGGIPAASFGVIDVREAAAAHIVAFEKSAKGRFVLSSTRGIPRIEICEILRKEFPNYPIPTTQKGAIEYKGGNVLPKGAYNHEKAEKQLGIQFKPHETSLVEMAKKLIELGIVHPPQ